MNQDTTGKSTADIIIEALHLARERVVGDDLDGKAARRQELDQAIKSMLVAKDTGQGGPTATELRGLLGDPDERELRHALDAWGSVSGEVPADE